MVAWEFEQIPALYEGDMVGDTLKGNFTQSGTTFSLELIRVSEASVATDLQRPQEPRPPFDYEEIETYFVNTAGQPKLVVTVTKPNGTRPLPAVVLVYGSGPQNRNGKLLDHQPFWLLADHLNKHGIVVFRYDDMGVGKSEADFSQ